MMSPYDTAYVAYLERTENEKMRERLNLEFCRIAHVAEEMNSEFIHFWMDDKYLRIRGAIRAERIA